MIIVELQGGLGNQMFQYAAARCVAERLGTGLLLDVSHYDGEQRVAALQQFRRRFQLDTFKIDAQIATPVQVKAVRDRWRGNRWIAAATLRLGWKAPSKCPGYYPERSLNFDPGVLRLPDNVYMRGYWQSYKYLAGHEPLIRQHFEFADPSLAAFGHAYVAKRRRGNAPVVAVHVRRGDLAYAVNKVMKPGIVAGPPVTPDYLQSAMREFQPDATFLVFSDSENDLEWCRQQIRAEDVHFCGGHTDLQDFSIMRSCDHNVVANSSFSWWAAWLNRSPSKRVVAPRAWFSEDFAPGFQIGSLVPPDWRLK